MSDFAGAVNLTSDAFPLLLASRFRNSFKAARAARTARLPGRALRQQPISAVDEK